MRNGFNSPTTPLNGPLHSSDYRERDVLRLFADGLPDSFEVFHNLPWSSIHQGTQHFGELDLVVISPVGHVNSESHYGCEFNIHLAKLPDKF